MPTLVYCRADTIIGRHPDRIETTRVEWLEGTLDLTANEAIAATKASPSRTAPADQFLRTILGRGAKWQKDVIAAAGAQGFSETQMKRAAQRLGVNSSKRGLEGWEWTLPVVRRRREPGDEG
jgi:hypothetical protein